MRLFALAALLAALPSTAAGQFGVEAEVERPLASTGGDDPTAPATALPVEDRETPGETLADVLAEAPGARPLRTGAFGSPATLSLRGANADQLEVLLDDVPLTTADGSAFDLSTIPLALLSSVEVYRGGLPTALGVDAIGGVLRLVPRRDGPVSSLRFGAGSFGLVEGSWASHVAADDVRWQSGITFTASEGDFPLLDDNRTALDPTDDFGRRRRNAFVRQASGLARLDVDAGPGELSLLAWGLGRVGGVPGAASQPTTQTRRNDVEGLAALRYRLALDDLDLGVSAAATFRRRRFTDRLREIGVAAEATDDLTARYVVRVDARGRPRDGVELTAVGLYLRESFQPRDRLAAVPTPASDRNRGRLALEARFHGRAGAARWELRPSARIGIVSSRLRAIRTGTEGDPTDAAALLPTVRLGAAISPVPGVTLSASVATATRAPSLVELFGDRGFLVGDPNLASERSDTVDLGVAFAGRLGALRGSAELRGFATFAHDLIRYVRATAFTAVPQNIGSAHLRGLELGARGLVAGWLSFAGALSLLQTEDRTIDLFRSRDPNRVTHPQLPLRPTWSAYARPTVHLRQLLETVPRVDLWVDVGHVSATFLDPTNLSRLDGRTRVGVGLGVTLGPAGRARVELSMTDLFDRRGTDLLGFPLPGRAFAASLRVRTD